MRKIFTLLVLISLSNLIYSQTDCEKAKQNFNKALQSMEDKQYVLSQEYLKESIELCPQEELKYSYELAWSYYLIKEYKTSIKILEPFLKKDSIPADLYQLLGNSWDEDGHEGMATVIYDKGFEKHPNAGCLFLERGNISYKNSNFLRALFYYEQGILKDPIYSSNYYRAAKIFLGSSEEVWGLVYGEIFMLLEPNSLRTQEMSKDLYNTFHSEIIFSHYGVHISLNDPTIIYSDSPSRPNLFPENYYNALLSACKGERIINIKTLVDIRTRFISNFYSYSRPFKNILFDYHKTLIDNNLFEAYNYWLFGYGNSPEASKWITQNKVKYDRLLKWMEENPLKINTENVFTRYKME